MSKLFGQTAERYLRNIMLNLGEKGVQLRCIVLIHLLQVKREGAGMFHIAICDDDEVVCERLEEMLVEMGRESATVEERFHVISPFYQGRSFYQYLKEGNQVDLVFLDIDFRERTG